VERTTIWHETTWKERNEGVILVRAWRKGRWTTPIPTREKRKMTYFERVRTVQGVGLWTRAGVALLALVAMFTIIAPRSGSAQAACADYISGGPGNPASGTLRGSGKVTVSLGFSAAVTGSASYSFNVGLYDMSDGSQRWIRCDTYVEWFGF